MTKATGYGEGATGYDEGTGWPEGAQRPAGGPGADRSGAEEATADGASVDGAGPVGAASANPDSAGSDPAGSGPAGAGPDGAGGPGPAARPPRPEVRPARNRRDARSGSYPRTSVAAAEYFGAPAGRPGVQPGPPTGPMPGPVSGPVSGPNGAPPEPPGAPSRSRGKPGRQQPQRGRQNSQNPSQNPNPRPPVPAPQPNQAPQSGPQPAQRPSPVPPQFGVPEQRAAGPRPAVPASNPQDVGDYAPWQSPLAPLPEAPPEPREGWRAALYGLSGRRLNLGLSPNERRIEAWLRTIDTPVTNHTIATMNVKGGAGKTTTTIAMGTAFAMHRRDQCIGIDANPDRGNLAQRLGQEHLYTIRDLLDNLEEITGAHTLRKFTNQAPSRFEVIASDRDPVKARAFTPHEYRTVQQVVRAFRQVILTDTGIDLTNPVVDAVLQSTDTLVVAASTAQDVAGLAWETLNTVEQRGFDHLVQRAVVSIIKEPSGDQVPLAELRSAFQDRCRAVVVIPNDRSLVGGGNFNWQALNGATRRAYLELAARVAEDFNTSRPW